MGRALLAWRLAVAALFAPAAAWSAECDKAIEVGKGETLYSLAETHYGDVQLWPQLFFANQPLLAGRDMVIERGDVLFVPCLDSDEAVPVGLPDDAEVVLLEATPGQSPFVSAAWRSDGLVTGLLAEALAVAPEPLGVRLARAEEIPDVRLVQSVDCTAGRCEDLLLSAPILSIPVLEFARIDETDKSGGLCDGAEGDVATCFAQLQQAHVARVEADALRAGVAISRLALDGQVIAGETPTRTDTLHVATSKTHWRATALIYRIDAGLARIRESGRYDAVLRAHMRDYWQRYAPR